MKFSIKDFLSKCDQIARNCRFRHTYWRNLSLKSLFFVQCLLWFWDFNYEIVSSKLYNVGVTPFHQICFLQPFELLTSDTPPLPRESSPLWQHSKICWNFIGALVCDKEVCSNTKRILAVHYWCKPLRRFGLGLSSSLDFHFLPATLLKKGL